MQGEKEKRSSDISRKFRFLIAYVGFGVGVGVGVGIAVGFVVGVGVGIADGNRR